MPSRITPQQYGQAVLAHAQAGTYSEVEEVISAELPPSVLSDVSKLIRQAQEDAQSDIRNISRSCAAGVDGWILNAKALNADIRSSQESADNLLKEAQYGEKLEEEAADAAGKVHLLNIEIAFNKSLVDALEYLQGLGKSLDLIQKLINNDNPLEAVKFVEEVGLRLPHPSTSGFLRVSEVLRSQLTNYREEIVEKLTDCWNGYIQVNEAASSILIRRRSMHDGAPELEAVARAFSELGMLDIVLLPFSQNVERLILLRRLQMRPDGTVGMLNFDNDTMSAAGETKDLSAQLLFEDLDKMIEFLRIRLPPSVMDPLAGLLMPELIKRLIKTWLASSVPENLDGMADFQETMDLANAFAYKLRQFTWPGTRELADWMGSIPDIWIRKRQEISLSQVRALLSMGFGTLQTVERVETQVLHHEEGILEGGDAGEDWNVNWSDNDPASPVKSSHSEAIAHDYGEEDVSAWGLDDDKEHSMVSANENTDKSADDEAEAWGWNDDENDEKSKNSEIAMKIAPKEPESNGVPKSGQTNESLVTLKETYNITSLPREILDIISKIVADALTLESPSQASFPVASAASELLSLPGLILAMYRASASSTYLFRPNGSMFLYNDSLWLAEQLRHRLADFQQSTAPKKEMHGEISIDLNLEVQIVALERYGKRAYSKEMESQRTIITDLLDGAQGFSNCTVHPFNQECDIAIASTVDRLRHLAQEWSTILSQSALLQTVGSLLTTVTSKMIVDIEDKSDISVPESQQLTKYCNRIAALEDLFTPQGRPDDEQAAPATAFYVPNWFKFQYLTNILDSSLADIKYLWTESELSLEFQGDELIELVMALFEDSEIRRKSIAEIRSYGR